MRKLRRLRVGQKPTREDFNELIDKVNALGNITGSEGIHASVGPQGIMLRGKRRLIGDAHKAYMKNDATSGATETCYLDVDATGKEITVNFSMANNSNMNAALPRLNDGDMIFVAYITDTWYCVNTFSGSDRIRWFKLSSVESPMVGKEQYMSSSMWTDATGAVNTNIYPWPQISNGQYHVDDIVAAVQVLYWPNSYRWYALYNTPTSFDTC